MTDFIATGPGSVPATDVAASVPRPGDGAETTTVVGEYASAGSWQSGGRRDPDRFDEMVDGSQVRSSWSVLAESLDEIGKPGLRRLRSQVERLLDDDGVTYIPIDEIRAEPKSSAPAQRAASTAATSGPSSPAPIAPAEPVSSSRQRWKLDPVPLIVDAAEWGPLQAALVQRATLLDLVLTDLYGPRTLIRRGFIPPELVFGSRAYLRPAHGLTIPGAHQLFFYSADVFRSPTGEFLAIGDRTEAPSGAGYAMADRRVVSRVSPDLFRRNAPHSLAGFFRSFLHALQSIAPRAAEDPRIVVLSPGSQSETAFDQAFVAGLLGLPLVESEDLTVRDGRVWMRALGRYEPVDVILRRVDGEYADPLDLRPDSQLGVVGLVQAMRRGSVSVVNTPGSGILENPGLLPFLPALAETLLSEPLKLPSVETFWCGDPVSLSHVLAHFPVMVMRPTGGGQGSTIVGRLDRARMESLREQVVAHPQRWVGQPYAPFSVAPVSTPDGLVARQVGMRLFAVAHQSGYVVMPGALGRVLPLDQQVRRASGLTEAKDVWILTGPAAEAVDRESTPWVVEQPAAVGDRGASMSSPRALEDMFWFGRYTERAEDFARLLIATWDRLEEHRQRGSAADSDLMTALLSAVTHASATYPGFVQSHPELLPEFRSLVLDRFRIGSIAQSLHGLTEAASGVRDQLSRDTWLVLAAVDRALAELRRDGVDRGTTLQATHAAVLSGMLALGGLAAENMVRDPGWYLMDIGRRIERSLQLVTVLRWTLAKANSPAVDTELIESVLQFAESILTYRRRYRGRTQIGTVLELLLLDAGNPRSLAYQLDSIANDFRALPDASGTTLPERLLVDLAAKVRRSNMSGLDEADVNGERGDLLTFLDEIRDSLSALADALAEQRFRHPAPMQQLDRSVGSRRSPERRSA